METCLITDTTTPDDLTEVLNSGKFTQGDLDTSFFSSLVKNKLDCCGVLLNYGAHLETRINGSDSTFDDIERDSSFLFSFNLTPLMVAAKMGYIKFVRFLVDNGADVQSVESFGKTALMISILNGHQDCAMYLIESGSELEKVDGIGMTPLNLAAERGLESVVTMLLSKGCAANHLNRSKNNGLHFAAAAGHCKIVKCFLENGVDASIQNIDGCNPLHLAIQNGHEDAALLLIENTPDLNLTDRNGDTALICAARKGLLNVIRTLVKKGCNLDAENNFGECPIHLAIQFGFNDVARCLIDNGVDVNVCNTNEYNPLMMCLVKRSQGLAKYLIEKDAEVGRALVVACLMNMTDIVEIFLSRGCDVDVTLSGETALHVAAKCGYVEIMDMLIDAGIDIDKLDSEDRTALMCAVFSGKINAVWCLVDAGCDLDIMSHSETALGIAAELGRPACTRLLIENGADMNLKPAISYVPLHIALLNEHKKCAEILIDNKCDLDAYKEGSDDRLLHCAINKGYTDIVKKMIEGGCDVNQTNKNNLSALHVAFRDKEINIAKYLIEKGANVNMKDNKGNSVLITAVNSIGDWEEEVSSAFEMLFIKGCEVNLSNSTKENALFYAATRTSDVVKLLLEHGADVNLKNMYGKSALHEAIRYGYLENTELLLRYGASPNDIIETGFNYNELIRCGRQVEFIKLLIRFGFRTELYPNYPDCPYRGLLANRLLDGTEDYNEDLLNLIYFSGSSNQNTLFALLKDSSNATLWENYPEKRQWLENACSRPMSLLNMTRIVVLRNLNDKPTKVDNIFNLSLPNRVKSFLDFNDV